MEIYERDDYLRGDIYYIKGLGYAADCDLDIWRPGIIISNDAANKYSPNVTVIPITSRNKKPLPTHVCISCKVQSTALCESIQTVAKARIGDYIKHCTNVEMNNIDEAMRNALALKERAKNTSDKETNIETLLAVANAERNIYKKLHTQSNARFTRIVKKILRNSELSN